MAVYIYMLSPLVEDLVGSYLNGREIVKSIKERVVDDELWDLAGYGETIGSHKRWKQ